METPPPKKGRENGTIEKEGQRGGIREEVFHLDPSKKKNHQLQICGDGPLREVFRLFLLDPVHLEEAGRAYREVPAQGEEV